MCEIPKISDSEWEVMKVIWSKNEVTSNEIIEELKEKKIWKNTTIKSLINRLLKKEAIGFKKDGKEYIYYPLVSEKECIREESKSFLQKVFNGSINEMMLNLVNNKELSESEIKKLKEILTKNIGDIND